MDKGEFKHKSKCACSRPTGYNNKFPILKLNILLAPKIMKIMGERFHRMRNSWV